MFWSIKKRRERKIRKWQILWHRALGESVDELPDIGCDFSLHFDIWNLNDKALSKCFSYFPNGDRILARADEVRSTKFYDGFVEDSILESLALKMNSGVSSILNIPPIESDKIRIYRGDFSLKRELYSKADPVTRRLDDDLVDLIRCKFGENGATSYFFLSETLYRLANYYEVSHWVIWAMISDFYEIDPYEPGYELFKMRAQAGWDKEGIFVFVEEQKV